MILPVRLYGDPILRKRALSVTSFDDNLRQVTQDMIETMYHHNGIGLAGPQVGIGKRLFIALEVNKDDEDDADSTPPQTVEEKKERWGVVKEHVIINPVISKPSGKAFEMEGCLSIPGLYVEDIPRHDSLHLTYQDVEGKKHQLEASGHFARVLQHEYDHLEGTLFLDLLSTDEKRNFMNNNRQDLAEMQREAKAFLKDIKHQAVPLKIS